MNYPFEHILYLLRRNEALKTLKIRLYRLLGLNCRYTLVILIAESIWYLPSTLRWILILPYLGNFMLLFWIRDYLTDINIKKYPEKNIRLLEELGHSIPDVKDHLINAWQLSRNDDELSQRAVQHFTNNIPADKLIHAIESKENSSSWNTLRIKTLISCLFLFIMAFFLQNGVRRLFTPGTHYPVPFPWTYQVHPGDVTLKEGDSLKIHISHTIPDKFPRYLRIIHTDKTKEVIPRQINDSVSTHLMTDLSASFNYRFIVRRPHIFTPWKERTSPEYTVTIYKRPVLELLEFEVIPPAYTGMDKEYYTGGTDRLHLLQGSELLINGRLSHPAGLVTRTLGKNRDTLDTSGKTFFGNIHLSESGDLVICAEDTSRTALESELIYRISLYSDEPPILKVIEPEQDVTLNESLVFPWVVFLSDDFGIDAFMLESRLKRAYQQTPDTLWKSHNLNFDTTTTIQTATGDWSIRQRLSPGDAVEFRFIVKDNNTMTGPGITRSHIFQARFPSMTELFEKSRQQSGDMQGDLETLQAVTKEMQEKAEALRKELFKKREADWAQQESMKNLTEQQEAVQETLKKIRETMEQQLKELSDQQFFSDEVLDNMGYLRELMEDLENSDIFRELHKMQEKLRKEPDTKSLKEMTDQFKEQADTFSETLERTIRLLETLRDMEALEEGERTLAEALREQSDLIENESQRQSSELAATEKKLSESMEALQKQMEMSEQHTSEHIGEKLKEFSEIMKTYGLTEALEKAAGAFSENKRGEGLEHAEQSRAKMEELVNQYKDMASGVQQAGKEEILRDFQLLLRRSLLVSEKQERLIPGTKDLQNDSPHLQNYFSRQNRIFESLQFMQSGLREIAQKTFFMGPRPFQKLESAITFSSKILTALSDGNPRLAEQLMNRNLSQLNSLTATLLALMGQAQESESGTGMEQYMEQLQAMAEMQGGINNDTQGMPMPGPGNQTMDLMSQIAARQQALRRQLSQLKQAMEQAGEGGGEQLDNINRDMEDVIRDLRQNRVSRRTIQRQRGIEQRLLDASRSIRKRDLSRERESRTGEVSERAGPERLPKDLGNIESLIRSVREKLRQTDIPAEDRQEMEHYLEKLRDMLE